MLMDATLLMERLLDGVGLAMAQVDLHRRAEQTSSTFRRFGRVLDQERCLV